MKHGTIGAALAAAFTVALAYGSSAAAQTEPGVLPQAHDATHVCPMMAAGKHDGCAKMHDAKSAVERRRAMQTHMKEMREGHERVMQAHAAKEPGVPHDPAHATGRGPDDAGAGQGHGEVGHTDPPVHSGTPHH